MEFVQSTHHDGAMTTLHDFGDVPDWNEELPLAECAVVLPMTGAECGRAVTADLLETLASVGPGSVVVPVRAAADRIADVATWLEGFDLPLIPLWCGSPALSETLTDAGISASTGKGRDVWLGVGVACERAEYVVVHDADVGSYERDHVARLLWPLTRSASFSKGYYARIEAGRFYGRLFRLFYRPLVAALRAQTADATGSTPAVLEYLEDFRYALAGDVGFRRDTARELRFEPGLGLEVGVLGDVFDAVGPAGVTQVDLGRYTHDHRPVEGPGSLQEAASVVGDALGHVLADQGVRPNYDDLPERYRDHASDLLDAYAADAAFNGLAYDRVAEAEQVDRYADAIGPPGVDRRLPPWTETTLSPERVLEATRPPTE
jgi:glucosyl-3-phosphoglycerate synthase